LYVGTCSYDGYFKIWDKQDCFCPIYELFSSKKWVFSVTYDPTTLCVFINAEGKHFPQKVLYLQPNAVVARKYNFFNENVLQTAIPFGSDFVYSSGINGLVYKMSKQDIQRHLVKQKEKLKNKLVQKLLSVHASTTSSHAFKLSLSFSAPTEDP